MNHYCNPLIPETVKQINTSLPNTQKVALKEKIENIYFLARFFNLHLFYVNTEIYGGVLKFKVLKAKRP